MAHLNIIGIREPVYIDNNRAVKLNEDWIKGLLPDIVDMDFISFKPSQLKAIIFDEKEEEFVFKNYTNHHFNQWQLDDIKEFIGDFESERFALYMKYLKERDIENPELMSEMERNKLYISFAYKEKVLPGEWVCRTWIQERGYADYIELASWKDVFYKKEDALQELFYRREQAELMSLPPEEARELLKARRKEYTVFSRDYLKKEPSNREHVWQKAF
ncbi:MAG: hypothetical protein AABY15_03925 [Nanoarchaeota archaeon]